MKSLYSLFSSELEKNFSVQQPKSKLRSIASIQTQSRLQLNYVPLVIDLDYYQNAHSSDNPLGDYKAAYRLYSLSDRASGITTYFESVHSIASVWNSIIGSATSDSIYVMSLLNRAQEVFSNSRMGGMGGIPEDWHLVNATPSNWCELVQDSSNLTRIQIEPQNENMNFCWEVNTSSKVSLDADSSMDKIYMDVLKVDFVRPWLLQELFDANWKIAGFNRGYFSDGSLRHNDGILPLITQSMLVGTNLSIEGRFSDKDIHLISGQTVTNLSVGPFAIKTSAISPEIIQNDSGLTVFSKTTQVLGFISQLIPLCPHESL